MSDLTKILRSNPVTSAALNAVEGFEKSFVVPAVHVAIPTVSAAITAAAHTALTTALGSGATIAEPVADNLIAEFTAWLSARL